MPLLKSTIYSVQSILNQMFDDTTNTVTVATSQSPATSIGSGRKTVTTAGTALVLGADTPVKRITIQALDTNTGSIAVGASGVIAAAGGTRTGVNLSAGDSYEIDINNLNKVFIDASVSGEGVSYTYVA